MLWRKLILQSGVLAVVSALATLGWCVYRQTNSEAVRRQVIEQLQNSLHDADVEVGSAWLRPLEGISIRDLRIRRRDDPRHTLVIIPAATIYHDKQMLAQSGRLSVRKIELDKPTIFIRRDADGKWPFATIVRPGTDSAVPTIVVRNASVVYEDGFGGAPKAPLKLVDCRLVVQNQSPAGISFQGQGESALGTFLLDGTWNRQRNELEAGVELPALVVNAETMALVAAHFTDLREHIAGLKGNGEARIRLRHQTSSAAGLTPEVSLRLRDSRFTHKQLPLPLERMNLDMSYRDNRIVIESLSAVAGTSDVTLSTELRIPKDGWIVDDVESLLERLDLTIRHLTLSPQLFARLPPSLAKLDRQFQPAGPITLRYRVDRRHKSWSKHCVVHAEGLTATYESFPYPVENLRGVLDQLTTSDGVDRLKVDLTAQAGDRTATVVGESGGEGERSWINLAIRCNDLPINEMLFKALRTHRASVEAFHPKGNIDFVATVRKERGQAEPVNRFLVHFRNLSFQYDEFPYPLEQVKGSLDIHDAVDTVIELRQIRGQHHGGEIRVSGKNVSSAAGSRIDLKVEGSGVPLDRDVAKAMGAIKLESTWRSLDARGRANFTAQLAYIQRASPPNAPPIPGEIEVQFDNLQLDAVVPDFLPYQLDDVACSLRYARDQITIGNLQARHGASHLRIGPTLVIVKPEGGLWARFRNLQLVPLVPDDDLLQALPPSLRSACTALEPNGPMSLSAELLVVDLARRTSAAPTATRPGARVDRSIRMTSAAMEERQKYHTWIYWENAALSFTGASVKLGPAWNSVYGEFVSSGEYRHGQLIAVDGALVVNSARVLKQPVQQLHAKVIVDAARDPDVVKLKNLSAKLYGGTVGGEGRVHLEPLQYSLSLKGVQLSLEEIAKSNRLSSNDLSGSASLQLFLTGASDRWDDLRGGGTIDVQGRMYNLPVLLDLLKFAKLRAPDGTAFDEAHAAFTIHGRHMRLDQFDLLGNLISLTGKGDIHLETKQSHLDIYTVWSRLVQMLPGPGKEISNAISRNLFRLEMSGEIGGQMQFRQQAIPVLVDPVKRLVERMKGH